MAHIPVVVEDEIKRAWEEHIEQSSKVHNMSHLVRHAVSEYLSADEETEVEVEIDGDIQEIKREIKGITLLPQPSSNTLL